MLEQEPRHGLEMDEIRQTLGLAPLLGMSLSSQ
jgi:hypothetical protein